MRVQSRIFAGSSPKHRRTFRDRAPILFASTAAALTTALTMRQRSHTSQDASRLEIPAFGYTMRFFLQRREALEPAGLAHGPFYFGAAIAWLLGLTADAPAKQSSWKRACRCTGAALAAEMQHASVRHVEHVNFHGSSTRRSSSAKRSSRARRWLGWLDSSNRPLAIETREAQCLLLVVAWSLRAHAELASAAHEFGEAIHGSLARCGGRRTGHQCCHKIALRVLVFL